MESVIERFLRYVSYDTQSDENSETCPSTAKQKLLGWCWRGPKRERFICCL